ncbi:MAG: cardiolipin synthase [Bacteroidaceae bacterium]|nr:cardiolipin synthase [Bacteroidaceae bacterium]
MDAGDIFRMLYWVNSIIAICITVKVVLANRNPVTTFAWIFVLLFLPYIGLALYFFFGRDTRKRKYIRRRFLSQIKQKAQPVCNTSGDVYIPAEYMRISSYYKSVADAYPLANNNIEVISDTRLFVKQLLDAIDAAEQHVHLQFYIFEDDTLGNKVRDALITKARSGVEVRLLYDSVGCWSVKRSFFDEIRRAGGYVESFLKVRFPLLTNKVNYRNHRKIVVIDGKTGFLGGCNIADRYIQGLNGGLWRDTMIKIQGEGVYGLQTAFLADWYFASNTMVCGNEYFPQPDVQGDALLQIVASNPVGHWRVLSAGMAMALSLVRNYVYLQTPYLMPNDRVLSALQSAALSGVDVRLMIPEHADSRIAEYASYSYLGELMQSGVKVYLYSDGFLHSKTLVADDSLSTVGSVNLDFRSFDYNFEVCACVYDVSMAKRMKALFIEDMSHCRQYTMQEYLGRSIGRRCLESGARLVSPVL